MLMWTNLNAIFHKLDKTVIFHRTSSTSYQEAPQHEEAECRGGRRLAEHASRPDDWDGAVCVLALGGARVPPQKTRAWNSAPQPRLLETTAAASTNTLSKTFGTPNSLDQLTDDVLAAWLMFLPTSFIRSVRSITPAHASQFFWP